MAYISEEIVTKNINGKKWIFEREGLLIWNDRFIHYIYSPISTPLENRFNRPADEDVLCKIRGQMNCKPETITIKHHS